jgi:hypothetical protein
LLHEPQLLGSLIKSVQDEPQSVSAPPQLHAPFAQPAPSGHAELQAPQL